MTAPQELVERVREMCAEAARQIDARCDDCAAHNDHDQCRVPQPDNYADAIRAIDLSPLYAEREGAMNTMPVIYWPCEKHSAVSWPGVATSATFSIETVCPACHPVNIAQPKAVQADNRVVYQCPRCCTSVEIDPTAKPSPLPAGTAPHTVEDGFGGMWNCIHGLPEARCGLQVLRPGKVQCDVCAETPTTAPTAGGPPEYPPVIDMGVLSGGQATGAVVTVQHYNQLRTFAEALQAENERVKAGMRGSCHDSAERQMGCFRAVRAERLQREAEQSAAQLREEWERECQDGDKITAALGIERTEGGSLNVGKMLHAVKQLREQLAAADMVRCLAFADAMKEVKTWPIAICSGMTMSEAVSEGWLKEIRKEPHIPRLGQSFIVYGISDAGRSKYHSLLNAPAIQAAERGENS